MASPGPTGDAGLGDCPFHKTLNAQQGDGEQVDQTVVSRDVVETPGPKPMGLRSAWDVSKILRFGIQEAMLQFFAAYGPIVR